MIPKTRYPLSILLLTGCTPEATVAIDSLGDTGTAATGDGTLATASSVASTGVEVPGSTEASSGAPSGFDVGADDGNSTGTAASCKVDDDMNGVGACRQRALADSFDPVVQWSWAGDGVMDQSIVIPLVANLTDDNGDGEVDLCDVPDVVVTAFSVYFQWDGYVYALDGATGSVHWRSEVMVDGSVTPALGDIDHDGVAEIVAVSYAPRRLVAFESDGALAWEGTDLLPMLGESEFAAIALADLDADGDVEILLADRVYDHLGEQVLALADTPMAPGNGNAVTAADLDGDGMLEVVLGRSAFHHDGTEYFFNADLASGFPQVANLDEDANPEVLVTTNYGIHLLEHDGAVKLAYVEPLDETNNLLRPASIHDNDGDGAPEFAVSSRESFTVLTPEMEVIWSAPVLDATGIAGGTAFDFLGDGNAEAMYADEDRFYGYDTAGNPVMDVPRSSGTLIEFPVVADIDDDGSAEILVVSNEGWMVNQTAPLIQALRDSDERWIQARRIWNQHSYHVTNVREDGTIPQHEPRSWEQLNTFRTNAQIEGGSVCEPIPAR